jgi:syntaxin 16
MTSKSGANGGGVGQYSLGTVRDRTSQFIAYREKGKRFSPASVYNTSGDHGVLSESSALLYDGEDLERQDNLGEQGGASSAFKGIQEVRNSIHTRMDSIRSLMEEIRILHGKASLNTFDDARDDEIAVEVATQQITTLFRACEKTLHEFSLIRDRNAHIHGQNSIEVTVQGNMQKTLALELQKLSLEFRKQQKTYLLRLRERDGRNSAAASALGLIDHDTEMDAGSSLLGLSELQSLAVDSSSAMAQERDREVVKIVTSIHDLAQIMKDLSVLVIEQGTVLDRIDYNLQQTSSVVEQGVSQLKRAEKAQRRGILASCVLILLVMIAVLFVVLIIKSLLS